MYYISFKEANYEMDEAGQRLGTACLSLVRVYDLISYYILYEMDKARLRLGTACLLLASGSIFVYYSS